MDNVSDITIEPCGESKYIKPLRMHYKQNGRSKIWDAFIIHKGVSIVIFNKSRNVLVLVKQFRPAIYINSAPLEDKEDGKKTINTEKYGPHLGLTYELCAGIVDKDAPLEQIAQEEVLEECGYKVPIESLERITSYRGGVGTTGHMITMFYVEVTDDQRVSAGGGLAEEGELIDVVEIPIAKGREFMMDETINKPGGVLVGLIWFYDQKWKRD